jgi:predicted ATPase
MHDPPSRRNSPPPPHGDVTLVSRDLELATLRALLDQSLRGHGRLVLIGGEAGIGKTTLLAALARHARELGSLVLSGGCYDLTVTPPYGPWIELSTRAQPGADALPIADMLGGGVEAIESQKALFERVAQVVATGPLSSR